MRRAVLFAVAMLLLSLTGCSFAASVYNYVGFRLAMERCDKPGITAGCMNADGTFGARLPICSGECAAELAKKFEHRENAEKEPKK